MGSNSVFEKFQRLALRRPFAQMQARAKGGAIDLGPRRALSLLDPRFWLLAPFFNFSVEKQALPSIVLTPLWRRKLGLKGTNGS